MMQTRRRIRCAEIHGQTPRGMQLSVSPWCAETSTSAEVEEPLPWERETTVRSLLKAPTEAGLATRSNSSNSLTASSRPRLPEWKRLMMTLSSSKHWPRAALTRRDMLPPREIDVGSWPGETNSLQFRFGGWRSSACCGMEWASGIGLLPAAEVYAG